MSKRKCTLNDTLQKQFPFLKKCASEHYAYCSVCFTEFSISSGGKSHIVSHLNSSRHKKALTSAASSKSVLSYARRNTLDDKDCKLAAAEGVLAFHNVKHNHSLRSMDCSSLIMKTIHDSSFSCARTKCAAIIENVFAPWSNEELKSDLGKANSISLYCDASNHGHQKIIPLLIRYFNSDKGICVKLLELKSERGETSEIISDYVLTTLKEKDLLGKFVGFCADNCNTNFGGAARSGENNVYYRLQEELGTNLIGIGCAAHIINNTIQTASDKLPIDIDIVLIKIYSFFHIYTVRVEALKDYCNYVATEYQQVLGYSKTRWLAFFPAVGRLLDMFVPLKAYFLSQTNCPVVLKQFFENEDAVLWLQFIYKQALMFHDAVKMVEGQQTTIVEVAKVLSNLVEKLESRLSDKFVPLDLSQRIFESNEKDAILEKFLFFYKNCAEYLKKWIAPFQEFKLFTWIELKCELKWQDVEKCLLYLCKIQKIEICDTQLYDEFVYAKKFADSVKISAWEDEKLSIDKRWVEMFSHFKENSIPFKNLFLIIERVLCLPGTNAPTERLFSVMNNIWTSEKNNLHISTLKAMLIVKTNFDCSCPQFYEKLMKNEKILRAIHSSQKYKDNASEP